MNPSASTVGSAIGAAIGVLLIIAMTQGLGWTIDAVAGAAISGGCSAAAGYFFNGGKAEDTFPAGTPRRGE